MTGRVKEQAKQTESVSSASEAAKAPRAPDQSQTSPGDQPASTTNAPPTPPSAPAASNPAASKAPPTAAENGTPASHDQPAANPPQTNIAQAPAAPPAPAHASQPNPNVGAMPASIAGGSGARQARVSQMPSLPFARARQGRSWTIACWHHWPQVRCRAELRLFAGDEGRQSHLGREDTGCLSRRSAEARPRQQDAVPRSQNRAGPCRRNRVSGRSYRITRRANARCCRATV